MFLELLEINSLQIQVTTKEFECWIHYWTIPLKIMHAYKLQCTMHMQEFICNSDAKPGLGSFWYIQIIFHSGSQVLSLLSDHNNLLVHVVWPRPDRLLFWWVILLSESEPCCPCEEAITMIVSAVSHCAHAFINNLAFLGGFHTTYM